ncbi:MAG TPA: hypothetical protein VLX58_13440 [Bryobacteraceae bacterium]|nr:hypothetical protein [Bryobacteraceae bacterium]
MKTLARLTFGAVTLAGIASFVASAQSVISAKSGLIHYVEGRVFLGDQLIESKFGNFPDMKENSVVRSEEGRAEVLLTPGVFLRIGENTSVRMITNRLIDTRVEFLSGSALVEADELLKDNGVSIVYKDYTIQLQKKGVYRFDSDPPAFRVYEGIALAQFNGQSEEVKDGRVLEMVGDLKLARFDKDKETDELYRWSRRRSEYLAMANVSAAKSVRDSGMYWGASNWYFNPYFNMFTFVPFNGSFYNPFGFAYWSPYSVYSYLYSPYFMYGGYGGYYGGIPRGVSSASTATRLVAATSSGHSGTVSSSSSSSSAGGVGAHSPSTAVSNSASSSISRGGMSGTGGGHAGGHPH